MTSDDIERYLTGRVLYGDDFEPEEVAAWYEDEREGYASLGGAAEDGSPEDYSYNNFNRHYTFRHLPSGRLGDALGLGAAYGGEFLPILDRLDAITILEPSTTLRAATLRGVPLRYVDPEPSGVMPFPDASFDLVSSFGVLHHIPNVSTVMAEVARVVRPGGYAVVREPIHSMGDWRAPRVGLTLRERGIPRHILMQLAQDHFTVERALWCDFPLRGRTKKPDARRTVLLDDLLSRAFAWNYRYHARVRWQKLRPRSLSLVLRRT